MRDEPVLHVNVEVRRPDGFELAAAFDAPPGVTILFGPSGSGKSTILATIAGLVRPDRGTVALGDRVWFASERGIDLAIHHRKVAFVFQSLALFPHLTAVGNVVYGMDRALERAERRARAVALLERLRVPHLADRRPATFSGGEAQRVALARAFAIQPNIVLFDEPFSAMDRELRRGLTSDVRAFVEELQVPVIHVTHHRNEARALGDRVVLLERGRVAGQGSLASLLPKDAPGDMSFDDTPLAAGDPDGAIQKTPSAT
jgi:molybdate transport system ATP-binding protein